MLTFTCSQIYLRLKGGGFPEEVQPDGFRYIGFQPTGSSKTPGSVRRIDSDVEHVVLIKTGERKQNFSQPGGQMKKRMSKGVWMLAAGIVVMALGIAQAQFEKPEDAIKYRKSSMFLMAAHFKSLGAMVQGKTGYEKEVFASNAGVVKFISALPWAAMMEPGTDKGDTTLSSAVFTEREKFIITAESFQAAAAKMADLAEAGDFEAAKGQFGAVAGGCKNCHSQFRTK
jgi:cytochrome c556